MPKESIKEFDFTPEQFRAEWVKALRSGKYQQGEGRLRVDGNKYCCLGVACEIYSKHTGIQWDEGRYFMDKELNLPGAVAYRLGISVDGDLDNSLTIIDRDDEETAVNTLAELNDAGESFSAIADTIEQGKVLIDR